MKSRILFAALAVAILVSIFFTYERSFIWRNFDLIDSSEETGGETDNNDESSDADNTEASSIDTEISNVEDASSTQPVSPDI